jgi:threonine/homoserine/homoserine lactone efflux protein
VVELILYSPVIIFAGMFVGVLVATPVGPVNILCIQYAVERGYWAGLAAATGVIVGDAVIALGASLGIGAISGTIGAYKLTIEIIGGVVLIAMGLRLFLSSPQVHAADGDDGSLGDFRWAIVKTFFLTITNPGNVLGVLALLGGASSFVGINNVVGALTLVVAMVGGSVLWWIGVSHLIAHFRDHLTTQHLRHINQGAGVLLGIFGLLLMSEVLFGTLGLSLPGSR